MAAPVDSNFSNKNPTSITTAVPVVPVIKGQAINSGTSEGAVLDGVSVSALSRFVEWLESNDTPVREFGISNSSLEEVFLVVTRAANVTPNPERRERRKGCCGCCCAAQPKVTAPEAKSESTNALPASSKMNTSHLPKADISNYPRKLSSLTQILVILRFFLARSWTGRPSIVNWVIFSIFAVGNMMNGFGMAMIWPSLVYILLLLMTVCLLSFMLVSVISPIYR